MFSKIKFSAFYSCLGALPITCCTTFQRHIHAITSLEEACDRVIILLLSEVRVRKATASTVLPHCCLKEVLCLL